MFTIAIVGRPNVGKSTLFNRLAGKRLALVDDTPGVTRDRREAFGSLGDLEFLIVDTAGLEEAKPGKLEARMRAQSEQAIVDADLCLFLIDARAGVTPLDNHFADVMRRTSTPSLVLANKCEGKAADPGFYEAFGLGLGDPIKFSAEHGEGLADLLEAMRPFAEAAAEAAPEDADENAEGPIKVAIVGRPNAGKSTLINHMIGQDRLLTGPEAGITRDSISVDWEYVAKDGERHAIRFHDTAGMRKKARVNEKLEKLSVADGLRAVKFAEVVVVMLDATQPFEKQDLTIAALIAREGRALVIAVNKWDLVEDKQAMQKELRLLLEESLPQVRGVPMVTFSAMTGRAVDKLMPAVIDIYKVWNARIGTGQLNRWLDE
ncbi:MAG: ribosome biogenesis GTPase Der, partial [Alphaproteobacteria bacterium]